MTIFIISVREIFLKYKVMKGINKKFDEFDYINVEKLFHYNRYSGRSQDGRRVGDPSFVWS